MPEHGDLPSSKPLRVLHLAHVRWFNAEVQYAVDLASEMSRRGHTVAFLGETGSPGIHAARAAGLATFEESAFNAKGFAAVGAIPAAVRLASLLRGEQFDAVEIHRPEGLFFIAQACRWSGVPAVRVRGNMRPVHADPVNRFLHSRILSGVVASNSAIARSLRERLGPGVRLTTIHGGVDPERFAPGAARADVREELGIPSGAFLVGILGRLGPQKGHADFLDAARLTLDAGADAAFVILVKEPTPREAELRARVESDPVLRERVRFVGRRDDLSAILGCFDLGVVASTESEGNCRVGLEWMASGVPLLATRVGVLPDIVLDGETGFLVPRSSPGALAEKIRHLADNRFEAARLGEASRRRVLGGFTLAQCADAHLTWLDSILEGRRREGPARKREGRLA